MATRSPGTDTFNECIRLLNLRRSSEYNQMQNQVVEALHRLVNMSEYLHQVKQELLTFSSDKVSSIQRFIDETVLDDATLSVETLPSDQTIEGGALPQSRLVIVWKEPTVSEVIPRGSWIKS